MNKTLMMTATAALSVAVSGCDKKAEAPKADAPKMAATADAMSNMAMPEGSKMGKGTGTVTALDAVTGKVTLDSRRWLARNEDGLFGQARSAQGYCHRRPGGF